MADGLRSRNMAPVYALVISFVLVLVFGLFLRDRATPTPKDNGSGTTTTTTDQPAADTPWKFQISPTAKTEGLPKGHDQGQNPENFAAYAIWGDTLTTVAHLKELNDIGVDNKVVVCVKLPKHWSMPEAAGPAVGGYTCSKPLTAQGKEKDTVTLEIVKDEG